MSDIVIRHAEPRDAEPLRMLMAHPEVYHDTLQIPYPSMEAWQEKLQPRPHTFHLVRHWTSRSPDICLSMLSRALGAATSQPLAWRLPPAIRVAASAAR